MVDIETHEESLKELSKTSLINNVTVILCWSALEAGRYLELYKTYEHAAPNQHQSASVIQIIRIGWLISLLCPEA